MPGQLRDEQVGVYRALEREVGVARGLAKSSGTDTWKPMTSKEDRLRTRTHQGSGRD